MSDQLSLLKRENARLKVQNEKLKETLICLENPRHEALAIVRNNKWLEIDFDSD